MRQVQDRDSDKTCIGFSNNAVNSMYPNRKKTKYTANTRGTFLKVLHLLPSDEVVWKARGLHYAQVVFPMPRFAESVSLEYGWVSVFT